jgi:hypothetical protein
VSLFTEKTKNLRYTSEGRIEGINGAVMADSLIFVVDTLDAVQTGLKEIFGEKSKPEHSVEILRMVLAEYDKRVTEQKRD